LKESTKPDYIKRLSDLGERLQKRAIIIKSVREFFLQKGFLEIETPLILDSPLPEAHIEAISAEKSFLRTSHEPLMKACLSAGYGKIFEIGPCFRKEEIGRLHREEFTMLEWYQAGASSSDLIVFTKELLTSVAKKSIGNTKFRYGSNDIDLSSEWEIITIKEAFAKFAGCDVNDSISKDQFEIDLIEKIEPKLPKDRPCIIKDYPAKYRAYAKLNDKDLSTADRWELYIAGIELANTYSELDNSDEIKKIMTETKIMRKNTKMREYSSNFAFDGALSAGIPKSAGSAMGIDRFVMLLTDAKSIEEVKI